MSIKDFFNIGGSINWVGLELSLTNKQLSINANQEREMSALFMVLGDFGFISYQAWLQDPPVFVLLHDN